MPTTVFRLCRRLGTTRPVSTLRGMGDDASVDGSITDTDVAESATTGSKGLGYNPPPYGSKVFAFKSSEPGAATTTFAF